MNRFSALGVASMCALSSAPAQSEIVAYEMYLPLDEIRSDKPFKKGEDHGARIFFDDSEVDPKTGRVKIIGAQRRLGSTYTPQHLDPTRRIENAWLDVKSEPFRYSSVTVTFEPTEFQRSTAWPNETFIVVAYHQSRRWEIRDLADGSVIIGAPYSFEKAKLTPEEIRAIMTPDAQTPRAPGDRNPPT